MDGQTYLRRLTHLELERSLEAILGPLNLDTLDPDLYRAGLARVGARDIITSESGIERFDFTIKRAIDLIWLDETRRDALIACDSQLDDKACADDFVQRVGKQAWRRPLTSEQRQRYGVLYDACLAETADHPQSMRCLLDALIRSPNFYYRLELPSQGYYTGYDMASRLSYFLWSLPPDDELLDAATRGELNTAEQVREQAARMLESPLAREGFRVFVDEWFRLDQLERLDRDIITYAFEPLQLDLGLSGELQAWAQQYTEATKEEIRRMVINQVFDKDEDYLELLVTRDTFVNKQLIDFYQTRRTPLNEYPYYLGEAQDDTKFLDRGLLDYDGDPSNEEFISARHANRSPRRGLLGTMGILSQLGKQHETSPTRRGNYVLEKFLCKEVGKPPPETDVCERFKNVSRRESIEEQHLCAPSCQGCHDQIDPIGFALDEFDTIGRHRTSDDWGEYRVDPNVEWTLIRDGQAQKLPFDGLESIANTLFELDEATSCVTKQLYRFATGREEHNLTEIEALTAEFARLGRKIKPFIIHFVGSDAFRREKSESNIGDVDLNRVATEVFGPRCAICHISASLGNLSLSNDGSLRTRLLAPSTNLPSMPLVTPGNLNNSYLWHKLVGSHLDVNGSGDLMPPNQSLAPEQLELVSNWIEEGAQ